MWWGSRRLWPAVAAVAFFLLGACWTFASPQGSATDEEFHLTSIWCAWGDWSGCEMDTEVVRPDGSIRQRVQPIATVPEYIAKINCYFYDDQLADCVHELGTTPVETRRFNLQHNPEPYYLVMRALASENAPASVQVMRLVNVLLASVLLGWALVVARRAVARGLLLAWGVAAIPLIVFYVASTNPSAWAIPAMGVFWAFCLSALSTRNAPRRRVSAAVGAAVATVLALSARFDSLVWIALSLVLVAVLVAPRPRTRRQWLVGAGGAALVGLLGLLAVLANFRRLAGDTFAIPDGNTATDQPNPIVKVVLEIPAFVGAMFGAQEPAWVVADNAQRRGMAGYVTDGLGGPIGDSFFASAVGYLLGAAAVAAVVVAVGRYRRRTTVAMVLALLALPVLVILMRALVGFGDQIIQPRYLLPWLLLTLGVGLTVPTGPAGLLSRGQAVVLGLLITTGGSLAWLTLASRYAVGQDAAFTNFGQVPYWWWDVGPSRLVWFLVTVVVTATWAAVALRASVAGRKPALR